MQKFRALGAPPPDTVPPAAGALPTNPQPPAAGGFAPRPPKQPPTLRISGYAPGYAKKLHFS